KLEGLRAGAPVFIPGFGALVALRDQPRDVLTEAKIAIAGPLAGACAAAICLIPYHLTRNVWWLALANVRFMLNLLTLVPFSFFDGGRVAGAISKKLWIFGFAIMGAALLFVHNAFMLLIVALGLLQMMAPAQKRPGYYEIPTEARIFISFLYFGLIAALSI